MDGREDRHTATLVSWDGLPGIPVSASALIRDRAGRILVLKPTYKSGWTLPGGVMEGDGETPWQACQREVYEETGLRITQGRLTAVDTRPAKDRSALGLRFLFDCGTLPDELLAHIVVQPEEIGTWAFVSPEECLRMLRPAVRRRLAAALQAPAFVYLEDGQPVPGVGDIASDVDDNGSGVGDTAPGAGDTASGAGDNDSGAGEVTG